MTGPAIRVCPRCGSEAGEHEYCQTCGLHLSQQPELPTRAQWEDSQAHEPERRAPSAGAALRERWASAQRGVRIAIAGFGLVGVALVVLAAVAILSGAREYTEFDVIIAIDEAADSSMGAYDVWRQGVCEGAGSKFSCEVFVRDGAVVDQAYESFGNAGLGTLTGISPTYDVVVDDEGCFEGTLTSERRDDLDEVIFGEDPTPTTLTGCGVGDYD